MKALSEFKNSGIKYVFTDIDDTLTIDGRLLCQAYDSIWTLYDNGLSVIPVTGRPAGWCELIARQWPVAGVIGENGGFYFCYKDKQMKRHFVFNEKQMNENREKLKKIKQQILKEIPGAATASDQFCRLMDLAIDFCEDVPALSKEDVNKIVETFKSHGATAKVSSIHVNGWFGDYDKLSMCKIFAEKELGIDLSSSQKNIAFVGDSPNDEPMFDFFENSFAVANINEFIDDLKSPPNYVASQVGGLGFTEISRLFL